MTIETTLYGKRLVTLQQLYALNREVSRAYALALQADPEYQERKAAGLACARTRK
jgi:hypothetical protein